MTRILANDRLFEAPMRRSIYEHIRYRPGVHLRELQRHVGLSMGTLSYHLSRLERNGCVVVRQFARYKSYFCTGQIDRVDKDYLYYLRHRMPARILEEVAQNPGISFGDLRERVPIAPSTLSYHLRKLIRAQLLSESAVGRGKTYHVVDAARVQRLLAEFPASVGRPPRIAPWSRPSWMRSEPPVPLVSWAEVAGIVAVEATA